MLNATLSISISLLSLLSYTVKASKRFCVSSINPGQSPQWKRYTHTSDQSI